MTSMERSGDINQQGSGTSIAHSGVGDINVKIGSATFTFGSKLEAGAAPSPASVNQTLPRDIREFTGRDDELQILLEAIEHEVGGGKPVLICAVDGMAGVGKTTLAVHVAHLLAARFPDGQLFMRLHAHSLEREPVDPFDALA